MTDIDLERVKTVLRAATGPEGAFSMRGLAKAANEGRDVVGDILNGRNRNPTLRVLANLARAMGGDLTLFGVEAETRSSPPTAAELAQALRDVLPGLPRGSLDRRTEYLAEALSRALRLPRDRPAIDASGDRPPSPARAAAAPPRAPNS